MNPALREAASRVTARVSGSRFAKPIARAVLVAAGLLLLAFIGKTAVAGAIGTGGTSPAVTGSAPVSAPNEPAPPAPSAAVTPATPPSPPGASGDPSLSAHTRATADDPVVLNAATIDDLKRLPGVGEKRATAIVAIRTRLGGRFRAVEDLLKVKGIGRATLRRLRPLVRLDPPAPPVDAGLAEAPR